MSAAEGTNTYPLTATTSTAIYPAGIQQDLTVKNVGPDTIWLGSQTSVSSESGYPLGPGSSVLWLQNRALYAIGTSDTSLVLVTTNLGPQFDASAVAAQISISGAPPVDQNDILFNSLQLVPINTFMNSPLIDVRKYQSIQVWAVDEGANSLARTVNISFGVDVNGALGTWDRNSVSFFDQGPGGGGVYKGSWASAVIPVRGPVMQASISTLAVASNVHLILVGSYKAVQRGAYRMHHWDALSSGLPAGATAVGVGHDQMAGFIWFGPAAGSYSWRPNHTSGESQLAIDYGGAGGFSVAIGDLSGNVTLVPLTAGPSVQRFIAPARPINVFMTIAGAPTYVRANIVTIPN